MSDIEVDGKILGQLVFEAYSRSVGGLTFDGKPIPGWDDLHGDRAKAQAGWEAAADEVGRWVRAGQIFHEPAAGPLTRAGHLPQKSRWEPLDVPQTAGPDVLPGDGSGTSLPP